MTLESSYVWPFACLFVRGSAMLLVSPLMGVNVPVQVRVAFAAVLAMALAPSVGAGVGQMPGDLSGLLTEIGQEALFGLLIGATLQLVMQGLQIAGAFLDMQMGLGFVQVLNPLTDTPTSLAAQFKYYLGLVLVLTTDGHHTMIAAFLQSYEAGDASLRAALPGVLAMLGQVSLLALQIAAPVAAVCFVIDAAAGLVNKSIPMMPVFLVSLPAKLMVSIVALGLALPVMAGAVYAGVGRAFETLAQILGG